MTPSGDQPEAIRQLTGGQGVYNIAFARYAQVPPPVQQKLAASFKLTAVTAQAWVDKGFRRPS